MWLILQEIEDACNSAASFISSQLDRFSAPKDVSADVKEACRLVSDQVAEKVKDAASTASSWFENFMRTETYENNSLARTLEEFRARKDAEMRGLQLYRYMVIPRPTDWRTVPPWWSAFSFASSACDSISVEAFPQYQPATLALLILESAVFLSRPASVISVAFVPKLVLRGELYRVLSSRLHHADASHFLSNMSSIVWCGAHLERRWGTGKFLAQLGAITVTSSAVNVCLAYFQEKMLGMPAMSLLSVGCSDVAFGLEVLLQGSSGRSTVTFFGINMPADAVVWRDFVLTHLLLGARASVNGHLAGIVAGLVCLHGRDVVRALLDWVDDRRRSIQALPPRQRGWRSRGLGRKLLRQLVMGSAAVAAVALLDRAGRRGQLRLPFGQY